MDGDRTAPDPLAVFALQLSRRRLLTGVGVASLTGGLSPLPTTETTVAQDATPAAIDPARLSGLVDLSRTLCGGGNFDSARATSLLGLLDADPALAQGLAELLASPPVDPAGSATPPAAPTSVPSSRAQAAAQAILVYWYVGVFNGDPVADRATAYYGLTAWQAMYTPPFAVCKLFGGWADPPASNPLVASA
jgi:hypothetical protein